MGVSYTNDIHPFWAAQNCTTCHTNANILDLTQSAGTLCTLIRDGSTVTPPPSPYLDDPTCSADNSWIIRVPGMGDLPTGAHTGGTDACFGAGGDCSNTILLWCTQGAPCP